MNDMEKEIRYLMYLNTQIIKEQRKKLRQLRNRINKLNEEKGKRRTRKRL